MTRGTNDKRNYYEILGVKRNASIACNVGSDEGVGDAHYESAKAASRDEGVFGGSVFP